MQLTIHATPGSRRNSVGGVHDGALRVKVTAPADQGRANDAIAQALARALGLRQAQVELIRGHTSRRKVFALHDPPETIAQRVAELMDQSGS